MEISNFSDARQAVAQGSEPLDAARALMSLMTPEEMLWCLDGDLPAIAGLAYLAEGGYQRTPSPAARLDRLGIPGIAFADGPRGAVVGNATSFPVAMARGATWDVELEERVGEAIGRELRAIGANFTGAVCVNLLRHPAWGRAQETYGEEPHHVAELGAAFTRGLQRHVMACVKHFACNSMENARFSVDVTVDEVALHEIYLPHFRRIVDEGVASVMAAYNSVNGEWCGQNGELLTNILRDEWGFPGFVISDFVFGIRDAAKSVAAGLDIEMPVRMTRTRNLPDALESGDPSWQQVERRVEAILATLLRFADILEAPRPSLSILGAAEHRDLARTVAARSAVLLRNEPVDGIPVLPLPIRDGVTLAVIGRLADEVNTGDGGSSEVWDLDCHTILQGIRAAGNDVSYDPGLHPASAAALARTADAAVVVVGYTHEDEGEFIGQIPPEFFDNIPAADEPEVLERFQDMVEAQPPPKTPDWLASRSGGFSTGGDRASLRLNAHDVELIRAVAAANPKTIVAIQAGSAVVVSEWIDDVPAVVQSWYAGCRAGEGLADVLFGAANFAGRLPFSVPQDEADLPAFDADATRVVYDRWHGWRHLARIGRTATFPFGFGLSYSTFEWGAVTVDQAEDALSVRGAVCNTGTRDGSEVIQIYVDLPDDDAPGRLVGFSRVEVRAGERAEFVVTIPLRRLAIRNPQKHAWDSPGGRHSLRIARHCADGDAHVLEVQL